MIKDHDIELKNEYQKIIDEETPDLWDRIEKGFMAEMESQKDGDSSKEEKEDKEEDDDILDMEKEQKKESAAGSEEDNESEDIDVTDSEETESKNEESDASVIKFPKDEEPNNDVDKNKVVSMNQMIKRWGLVAAAILLVVIAVPVSILSQRANINKSADSGAASMQEDAAYDAAEGESVDAVDGETMDGAQANTKDVAENDTAGVNDETASDNTDGAAASGDSAIDSTTGEFYLDKYTEEHADVLVVAKGNIKISSNGKVSISKIKKVIQDEKELWDEDYEEDKYRSAHFIDLYTMEEIEEVPSGSYKNAYLYFEKVEDGMDLTYVLLTRDDE